jgi:hypothetical protein
MLQAREQALHKPVHVEVHEHADLGVYGLALTERHQADCTVLQSSARALHLWPRAGRFRHLQSCLSGGGVRAAAWLAGAGDLLDVERDKHARELGLQAVSGRGMAALHPRWSAAVSASRGPPTTCGEAGA